MFLKQAILRNFSELINYNHKSARDSVNSLNITFHKKAEKKSGNSIICTRAQEKDLQVQVLAGQKKCSRKPCDKISRKVIWIITREFI